MQILELDYNQWRCGEHSPPGAAGVIRHLGSGKTSLVTAAPEHGCCCIGLMLLTAGVPRDSLINRSAMSDVVRSCRPQGELQELLFDALTVVCEEGDDPEDNELVAEAYILNDGPIERSSVTRHLSVAERMWNLFDLFREHELVELRWVNAPPDIQAEFDRMEELDKQRRETAAKESQTPDEDV